MLSVIPGLNITLKTVEAVGPKAFDTTKINHLISVCGWFERSMRRSLVSVGLIQSEDYVELENTDTMVEEMRELLKRAN